MENEPQFAKASDLRNELNALPEWKIIQEHQLVDFDEVIRYLVEYPESLAAVSEVLPKWILAKTEHEQIAGFIEYMLMFPDATQRQEKAVLANVYIGDWTFIDSDAVETYTGVTTPEFIKDILDRLETIAFDYGRTSGIYFWAQIRTALEKVNDAGNAAAEFIENLHPIKSDDIYLHVLIHELKMRDAMYGGFLPFDSEIFKTTQMKLLDSKYAAIKDYCNK